MTCVRHWASPENFEVNKRWMLPSRTMVQAGCETNEPHTGSWNTGEVSRASHPRGGIISSVGSPFDTDREKDKEIQF